jgi:aryl-alcohol dehydrogenase (NADP+)
MEIVNLGESGLKVSRLALGTMTFGNQSDEECSFRILDKSAEAGINLLDCADIYPLGGAPADAGNSEVILGKWLKGKQRDSFVITSKCFAPMGTGINQRGLSRLHILNAAEASLKRLDTDYIDLYMAHSFDNSVPMEETLGAFEDIVRQGKVRYVGVSNWAAWQIVKALGIQERKGWLKFISNQCRYNLLFRRIEDDIVPMCLSENIGLLTYNPLAGGLLTGKYRAGKDPDKGSRFDIGGPLYRERYWKESCFEAVRKYVTYCGDINRDPATTAVRWVLEQPGVSSVLIGARLPEQLDASLNAVNPEYALKEDERKALEELWFDLPRSKDELIH